MSYNLEFDTRALKEWKKLGPVIRDQFKEALKRRLLAPRIEAHALSGMKDHYKITLRAAGYRLVYRVEDDRVVVTVVAVGKREGSAVYAKGRDTSGLGDHRWLTPGRDLVTPSALPLCYG